MKKLNLIFLDIDGVMNNENYFHNGPEDLTWDTFDPKSVELLNKLTDVTSAKIIISSDWRKSHLLRDIQKIFNQNKVKGAVIGTTPNVTSNYIIRGIEIQIKQKLLSKSNSNSIFNYVILDDDASGILLSQKDNFVKTDPVYGFTNLEFEKAINILI